jgi:chitin synthase
MHFGQLRHSGHGNVRMLFLHFQLLYNIADVMFSWFSLASFYLATTVIMTLVGTPVPARDYHGWPFGDTLTPFINVVIRYVYVAFLILQFILALGNRPKGSRHGYKWSFIVFGTIQAYVIVLTSYLVCRGFSSNTLEDHVPLQDGTFVGGLTSIAGLILLALLTIYGINFFASFLYLDAWHMFHSFPQYLVFMSTYTNILMVYAFNNWHDVSWGTKGSDVVEMLPSAHIIKSCGSDVVFEEVEREQEDLDSNFENAMKRALAPPIEDRKKLETDPQDSYKAFRTGLVYSWLLSNILLIITVTTDDFGYMGVEVCLMARVLRSCADY